MDNPTVVQPYDTRGSVIWYNHFGKLFGCFCQSWTYNSAIAFLGMYPTEMQNMFVKRLYKNVHSIQVLLIIKSQTSFFMFDHWWLPRPTVLPYTWPANKKAQVLILWHRWKVQTTQILAHKRGSPHPGFLPFPSSLPNHSEKQSHTSPFAQAWAWALLSAESLTIWVISLFKPSKNYKNNNINNKSLSSSFRWEPWLGESR